MHPLTKKYIAVGLSQEGVIPTDAETTAPSSASTQHDTETLRNEAALLLSIADICSKEMKDNGISKLWDEAADADATLFPKFPALSTEAPMSLLDHLSYLKPRSENVTTTRLSMRPRAVSMDTGRRWTSLIDPEEQDEKDYSTEDRSVLSPVTMARPMVADYVPIVSPSTPEVPLISNHGRLSGRKTTSLRMFQKAKRQHKGVQRNSDTTDRVQEPRSPPPPVSGKDKKGKCLQGIPPKGVRIQKIMRKKFSWKNYPELERFLVVNREEYLRHSALNYTVQQKQYNNRLTDELLRLATQHGYLFDTSDFSYVTVRDRIRCYYKSFVQSAKKRGVLMGYAARKAGLLDEEDLEMGGATGDNAPIIKSP